MFVLATRTKNARRVRPFLSNMYYSFPSFCCTVWKKKQLDLYEPFKSLMYVYFEVLPLLTFGYISGPFKGYIVRYGYDASLHPESRFLQVVHYRMNKREFYNVKQR